MDILFEVESLESDEENSQVPKQKSPYMNMSLWDFAKEI
jgi:hypothetical protein